MGIHNKEEPKLGIVAKENVRKRRKEEEQDDELMNGRRRGKSRQNE